MVLRVLLPACCLLLMAALCATPVEAQPTTVRLTTDSTDGSIRVVLTHSREVVHAIRSSRKRIEVVYAERVVVDPPQGRLDDPILLRYEVRDERTLILFTGRGYEGYESFELRNPFRLILDLQGKRRERSTRKSRKVPSESVPSLSSACPQLFAAPTR